MANNLVARPCRQRTFRIHRDPLGEYSDAQLVERYRLDSGGLRFVAGLERDRLQSNTRRNHALTPEAKVAITLRYPSTGKMQLCSAEDFGVNQPTVSRVIAQTLEALTQPQVYRQFVRIPRTAQEIRTKFAEFHRISRFPDVFMVIDCTHIQIVAPVRNEQVYVNRKNQHSINVQVVSDARANILDVVARWPGSVHDARILDESGIKQHFERNVPVQCHLLGDSGYPYKNWLKTPYLCPEPGYQSNYNMAHKRTRSIVGRTIGQVKRRFHGLHGEVRLSPAKTCRVVYACVLLHNLCKARNIPMPREDDSDEEEEEDEVDDVQNPQPLPRLVRERRNQFARLHFGDEE